MSGPAVSQRNVSLVDLETFLRVADRGSFTAAAQEIGAPKSTVSRRVGRLEAALDVALLVRTPRAGWLRGTDAGLLFRLCRCFRSFAPGSEVAQLSQETSYAMAIVTPRSAPRSRSPRGMPTIPLRYRGP